MPTIRISNEASEMLEAIAVDKTTKSKKIVTKPEAFLDIIRKEFYKMEKANSK